MDASKQITTLSPGKWVTFRKTAQSDQAFQGSSKLNDQNNSYVFSHFSRRCT